MAKSGDNLANLPAVVPIGTLGRRKCDPPMKLFFAKRRKKPPFAREMKLEGKVIDASSSERRRYLYRVFHPQESLQLELESLVSYGSLARCMEQQATYAPLLAALLPRRKPSEKRLDTENVFMAPVQEHD